MKLTAILQATKRTPLIKFVGKRHLPQSLDQAPHAPFPHPASPTHNLPNSFASYRSNAQQHGPLGGKFPQPPPLSSSSAPSSPPLPSPPGATYPYGAIGGHSGAELGSIQPKKGEFFDRSELPRRFHKTPWTNAEIDAIETGGASLLG